MPGMFGRVRLPSVGDQGNSGSAVSVPAAAVADRGGLTGVFVVGKDQRVTFRWVRLGDPVGDRVVVTSGLSTGERILARRSEEHTSELQSLMRNSYAVFYLKKK